MPGSYTRIGLHIGTVRRLLATAAAWTVLILLTRWSTSRETLTQGSEFLALWLAGLIFGVADAMVIRWRVRDARRNEERYRHLFDNGPLATFVFSPDADSPFGVILDANQSAARLLGVDPGSLVGRPASGIFNDVGPDLQRAIGASLQKPERVVFETSVTTAAGGNAPVEAEFTAFDSELGPAILVVATDLGDVRTAQRSLRRQGRQLIVLSNATRQLNEELDLDMIAERLVTAAMEATSAISGVVGFVEGDEIAFHERAKDSLTEQTRPLPRLKRGEGVAGYVWETMAPYVTNDAPRDTRLRRSGGRITSLVAVPIIDRDGEFLGCLQVHDRADHRLFTDDDIVILSGLAASAATAIENTRGVELLLTARSELLADRHRLRSLAAELSRTSESERRGIAAELHDGIGQYLAIARMKLGQAIVENEVPQAVADARDLVDRAIADTRSLTFQLSPPLLYELGLGAAIEWLAEETEKLHDVAVSCQVKGSLSGIPDDLRALVYVCTRELVLNAVKHAAPDRIEVSLACTDEWLRVTVRDDGCGFDTKAVGKSSSTFGLFSVSERLSGFGGTLELRSGAKRGSTAVIAVPFELTPAAAGDA